MIIRRVMSSFKKVFKEAEPLENKKRVKNGKIKKKKKGERAREMGVVRRFSIFLSHFSSPTFQAKEKLELRLLGEKKYTGNSQVKSGS
jgi:hypothetical protein